MNYHNITHDDMLNGDGIRVVLWVSGCNHHCKGCQNPITWDAENGIVFDINAKEEIYEELKKDYVSGLTLSGGDPLNENNVEEIKVFIREVKSSFPQKTIWLYTGYEMEEILDDIRLLEAVVLVDVVVVGKFELDKKDIKYKWCGSTNQRVIDVKRTFEEGKIILHESN